LINTLNPLPPPPHPHLIIASGEEELVDDEVFRMTLKREQENESEKKLKGVLGNGMASDEEIQQALSETGAMWKTYENAKVLTSSPHLLLTHPPVPISRRKEAVKLNYRSVSTEECLTRYTISRMPSTLQTRIAAVSLRKGN
jgi:hypothetical protein